MDTPESPFEALQSLYREAKTCKIAAGLLLASSMGTLTVGVAAESESSIGAGFGLALGSVFTFLWSYGMECQLDDLTKTHIEEITDPVDE